MENAVQCSLGPLYGRRLNYHILYVGVGKLDIVLGGVGIAIFCLVDSGGLGNHHVLSWVVGTWEASGITIFRLRQSGGIGNNHILSGGVENRYIFSYRVQRII